MASAYSKLNDYQSASQQLEKIVSETPSSFEAIYMQATLMAQTGRWEEAEQKSKQALSLSPGHLGALLLNLRARSQLLAKAPSVQTPQGWLTVDSDLEALDKASNGSLDVKLLKFQCALLKENIPDAENCLAEMKKLYPSDIKTILTEAILLSAKKMPEQSLSTLSQSIKQFPEDEEFLDYYVLLSIRNKKNEECIEVLKDALAKTNQRAIRQKTSLLLSRVYNLSGKEDAAQNLLAALEKELPEDISIKRQLLLFKKVKENAQQAQQLIDSIKSVEGDSGWQWRYEQAKLWLDSDNFRQRYPQIISILKENLRSNPADNYSNTLMADAYSKAEDYYLAAQTYNEAKNRSPQDIRLIIKTVAALQRANEYAQADEILAQAARQKLFAPDLKKLELQSLLTRGDLKPAGQILEDMLTDDPNNSSIYLALASLRTQQRQFEDAEKLLKKFRSIEPNLPAAIELQVKIYLYQNKMTEAINFCNEMAGKLNNAYAYSLRGRTYAYLKQNGSAAKDFEQAINIEPKNAISWLTKSDFELSIGRLADAVSDMQKVVALEPNNVQIQKRAVSLYLQVSNPATTKMGIDLLGKAIEKNPSDYQLQILKARTLLFDVNYPAVKKAKAILQSVTEQNPGDRDSWLLLGEISLRYEQEPSDAMNIALKGLAHNQNDRALLLLKARAEAVIAPASAILTLRGLLGQDPNDIESVMLLSETLMVSSQFDNAVELLRKQQPVFAGTPYQRQINISLGRALYKSGDKGNSEQIFKELYASEPNNYSIFVSEIRLLKDDKLWELLRQKCTSWYQQHPSGSASILTIAGELAAVGDEQASGVSQELLNVLLKGNPDYAEAMNTLGILLSSKSQFVQAAGIYNRLLELRPDNAVAMNNLAWVLCRQKQYEQALELAQKGLRIAPNYIDLIDTRGLIYFQMGKLQEASQDFSRCLELYLPNVSSRAVSSYHLGQVFYKLKDRTKASDILKQAIQLNDKVGGLSSEELKETREMLEQLTRGV
jgi:tetratricopeptide (TPR) repeat protein